MAKQPEAWPPPPTRQPAATGSRQPSRRRAGLVAGFTFGLIYSAGIWYASYSYARSAGFCWQLQLPLGLAVPDSSPAFIMGLSAGLLVLLLSLVLLRSRLKDFSKGLVAGCIPLGFLFLFVLLTYISAPKGNPCGIAVAARLDAELVGWGWHSGMQAGLALGHPQVAGILKALPPGENGVSQPAGTGRGADAAEVTEGTGAASGQVFNPHFFVLGFQTLPG